MKISKNLFCQGRHKPRPLNIQLILGFVSVALITKFVREYFVVVVGEVVFTNSRPRILTLSSASTSIKCQSSGTVDKFSQEHRWRAISKEQESFKMVPLPHPTPLWRIYFLCCKGREPCEQDSLSLLPEAKVCHAETTSHQQCTETWHSAQHSPQRSGVAGNEVLFLREKTKEHMRTGCSFPHCFSVRDSSSG